jgi:hypothetical protein
MKVFTNSGDRVRERHAVIEKTREAGGRTNHSLTAWIGAKRDDKVDTRSTES